jgi:outer membrane protein TolC
VLHELVRTALPENKDLTLAVARVAEARAQLGVTRADQFPQLDAGAGYTNQGPSEKSFPFSARGSQQPAAGVLPHKPRPVFRARSVGSAPAGAGGGPSGPPRE